MNANEKEKHFPILPSPSLFPLRAFLFSFPFLFSLLFSFSVKNEHEEPAVVAHNTLARLSLLSGLGLTFQQGPGVLFPSACLISKVCDLFAQGSCFDAAPTFLPLSLEVFVQPKGIVPESAVLVRSFSLVFSYLCTQRCGTVCECRESLLSHPFSYETWWNRAQGRTSCGTA